MLSLNLSHCLCSAAMPISSTTILINQVSRWHILLPRIESLPHWPTHFLDLQTPTKVFMEHTELMFVMNEWTFYGLLKVDMFSPRAFMEWTLYLDKSDSWTFKIIKLEVRGFWKDCELSVKTLCAWCCNIELSGKNTHLSRFQIK